MPSSPSRAVPEFLPTLERGSGVSLERQLALAYREAILEGLLLPGSRLPSSRDLASTLGVHRNTVVSALEGLVAEGCLQSVRGSGTFVSADVQVQPTAPPEPALQTARWLRALPEPSAAPPQTAMLEFRVCQPSTRDFPMDAWRRAWREATRTAPPDDYGPVAGEAVFRQALAGYLRRARGLHCAAQEVLVTNGSLQAVQLIAQATLTAGARVAFEDPGYPLARQVLEGFGAVMVPIPVDEDGLRVDLLPSGGKAPHLVYLTPSHQFPLGGRLSLGRRQALLDWAQHNDALILEDDYDSEFRFDVSPLPALASLDRTGRVAYLGTFSKVLSPALRVGYVVATPALLERLKRLKTLSDYGTSSLTQTALEHFLSSGALERHISRMRRVYAHKREALLEALQPLREVSQVRGLEAGLNLFLECDPHLELRRVEQDCAAQGVGITLVQRYAYRECREHGLVLGYGGLEIEQIERAAKVLVRAVQSVKT